MDKYRSYNNNCLQLITIETIALGLVYTMDHEVGSWKMAFLHGPTSMAQFLKN